jgi:hypothetical protein
MSTKSSLAHGENFHFYEECFDDQHVYLELENTEFEVFQTQRPNSKEFGGRVMVRIPLLAPTAAPGGPGALETIQQVKPPHMDLVGKSDQELLEMVQTDVDERIARNKTAIADGKRTLGILMGSLAYGPADKARDVQIQSGITHFTEQRNQQREILERSKSNWLSAHRTDADQSAELPAEDDCIEFGEPLRVNEQSKTSDETLEDPLAEMVRLNQEMGLYDDPPKPRRTEDN